jgi:hypothetical protein
VIKDDLENARIALEAAAQSFAAVSCSGTDAVSLLIELGSIRRLADGLVGKVAKRVQDTAAHTYGTDRNAAELCSRLVGVSSGEAKRAIVIAAQLESLPATDAAVRAGSLSSRQVDLIAGAAADDPTVERSLLKVASRGMVALRDKCIAVRAEREDETARARRHEAAQSFKMWPSADGMMEGHFTVTPQVGGRLRAYFDREVSRRFRDARSAGAQKAHERYAVEAFTDAILGGPTDAKTVKSVGYSAHVLIDHEVLTRGHALPGETCEIPGVGPVNARWVREILGDAFVTAIIKKGKDITTVAHLGRHIPAELMTAMIVSGRECVVEGCSGREYLELDHCEVDHAKGGPTAKWNLAFACSIHHKLKTTGWILGPPDPITGKRRLDPPPAERAA